MEIKKILPQTLIGPRTYFSLIDRNNVLHAKDWELYKNELDQIIKILLLTKETIVVAGSSLCTKKAYEYFSEKDKYLLFKKGFIKPAIRSQFNSFTEVFNDRVESKKETLPIIINNFFSDNISEIVPWDLQDNSGWFLNQFAQQVYDSNSILRNNLKSIDLTSENLFVKLLSNEIENLKVENNYFDRDKITLLIYQKFTGQSLSAISQFLDLLYYISGSRVVNCENHLPQENLIYYNHATMNFGQNVLSDKSVFNNIVTQAILSNIYDNTFPIDIIQNLSFKDVLDLRESNKSKSQAFREKYELCLKVAQDVQYIDDRDVFLANIKELSNLSIELRLQFDKTIKNEIKSFKSKIYISKTVDYVFEIASQLIGLFSLPVSIVSLIFNDTKLNEINFLKKSREKSTSVKENLIRGYLKEKYNNDPVLISFFNDIIKKHKENYLKLNF